METAILEKESLTVEFKSDQKRLSDRDLVATVVCLANTDGGEIYLGVEKDAVVTGLHHEHQNPTGLTALIGNRTNPPLSVRVEILEMLGKRVAKIIVPKSKRIVSTSDGVLQRRRLMADGTPQCVPFYPHEFIQRESDLGLLDYSALPVAESTPKDLDPLERQRLRQMIERYGGDRTLLALNDEELDGALGFIRKEAGSQIVSVAGLLMLGRESPIRERLPTHEVAFQVLEGTQVKVNDFYRTPLLRTFGRIMDQFEARVEEDEIQVGLFRVPIPTLDKRSFREAFVNALTHRDYTQLGSVYVRMDSEGL
ncbi:MAG: ATPase, partial [Deltaproteobacteria bacterium CG_4_8_14_3_um_filter_45_9]